MPSKISKLRPKQPSLWKVVHGCSEARLAKLAIELAAELKRGDRVLLRGPMGVGKSTFARALLIALKIEQPPEGSPSFAIVHEYHSPGGGVAHMDLFRLQSEQEVEEAGLSSYLWERSLIVITEWSNSWPEFEAEVLKSTSSSTGEFRAWCVDLAFHSPLAPLAPLASVPETMRDVRVEVV